MLVVVIFFSRDAPAKKCPRHLNKVQCNNALLTEFEALGIWKFRAPGTTDGYCTVFWSTVAVIPWSLGCWPLGQGLQGSSHLQGGFPQQGPISSGVFITWSQPTSPGVSWAELPNTSSPVHLWWWSAPLHCLFSTCDGRVHCLCVPNGHPAKVVRLLVLICRDKSFFIRFFGWPLGSRPAACCRWLCLCHQP